MTKPLTLEKPKKASWRVAADEDTLLECLRQQQVARNQSDTGFKSVVWTACAAALQGSEKWSGGGLKTAKGCKDHFGAVSFFFHSCRANASDAALWASLLAQRAVPHCSDSSQSIWVWVG
jgi:hypothetical protein